MNSSGEQRHRSRVYRCEGIVIRRRDFGEADRLLTILSDDFGKIRALAKGSRRTRSRLGGHLEPYARVRLMIARGRNLDIITQAQVLESMTQLRTDERSILYAAHWSEIADQLMVEGERNRFGYGVLVRALTSLELARDPVVTSRICEWEFLAASGFQPELFQCTSCGRPIEPGSNGMLIEAGGVVCPECHALNPLSQNVSNDALRVLRAFGRRDGDLLYDRALNPELLREIEQLLINYLRSVIERELHAWQILSALEEGMRPPESRKNLGS